MSAAAWTVVLSAGAFAAIATIAAAAAATHESPLLPAGADALFRTRYAGGWRTSAADNTSLPVKLIPRHVWIGMRTKPNATWLLKEHLQRPVPPHQVRLRARERQDPAPYRGVNLL